VKSLVLGGVRSGKSQYAEGIVKDYFASQPQVKNVTLIATALALDESMSERIANHQKDRPSDWTTKEVPVELAAALRGLSTGADTVVLIDCLTLWLTNLLMAEDLALMKREIADFLSAVEECETPLVIVSNETNMGVMPMSSLSRLYCDEIGMLHQQLAKICDSVLLIVAGLPMTLKSGEVSG